MSGSAAATPLRTATPDAVVCPLQYAVALNCRRAPGIGRSVPLSSSACRDPYRESETVASYKSTKAATSIMLGKMRRQKYLLMRKMFEPVRQLLGAAVAAQEH